MKKEELYRNIGYWTANIQMELYDILKEYMNNNNLNRTQLAKKLGFSKGYITQVLNGDFDHKISKFVELALAVNKIPRIEYLDLEEVVNDELDGYKIAYWSVKIKKQNTSVEDSTDFTIPSDLRDDILSDISQPLVSNFS